jgi:prepilin signal peptidase PulO-like enzyme (type II secretory pathway)
VVFALLGAAIGSFLNVIVDRLPQKQSLVFPPSHCPACGRRLRVLDLVPVFSYLGLRGRCRYCQSPIPRRILGVEFGTMAGFVLLLWRYGLSLELVIACFYWSLLTVIMVIALERRTILDRVFYPAVVIILIMDYISGDPGLLNGLLGAGVGLIVMIPLGLGRGSLGWGDVKMAGLAGLMLGFPEGLVSLMIAVLAAGLMIGWRWLLRATGRKKTAGFIPFLAVATMVMLLWGQNITGWYLSLF